MTHESMFRHVQLIQRQAAAITDDLSGALQFSHDAEIRGYAIQSLKIMKDLCDAALTELDLGGQLRDSVGQLPLVALGPDSTIKTGGVG